MRAFLRQLGRYAGFVAWFFRDALLRYRSRLVLIIAANVAGVGLQTLAVVTAYRYATAVEKGTVVSLAGATLDPRASIGLLVATAVAVFVLAVSSAALIMRARVAGARVALEYADYCRERVYLLASRLPAASARQAADEYTMQTFLELARRDPHYWFNVLRMLIYALLHIGTIAVAGVALLYLNAGLTLLVFVILAVAAWFLRRASIRAAAHRARQLEHSVESIKEQRLLEDRVMRSPAPLTPSSTILQQAFTKGGTAKARDALLGQRQALEGGKLIAQVAIGGALFMVLIVQGGDTLGRGGNWSALLAYVAALTFFGGSLARVGRMLVSMNRFYPPLARHARFVERAREQLAAQSAGAQPASHAVQAPALGAGASGLLVLRGGERAALVVPGEVNRYAMVPLAKALGETLPWFAGAGSAPLGGSLRDDFGLPAECSRGDVEAALAALGAPDRVALPASLDQPLTEAQRQAFAPAAAFLLLAVSGQLNQRPILALDHAGLALLEPAVRAALLEKASGALVFIVHRAAAAEAIGGLGESAVVICGAEAVFGWATIEALKRGDEAVRGALERSAADVRATRVAGGALDDMDDLE